MILFIIFLILGILFTITYDIYSYHIAAYYSLKLPFSQIFDRTLYFDRFPDYPPLGVYLNIFIGKLFSFIYPLSINDVKLLFIYKLISVTFLIMLYAAYNSVIKNKQLLYHILFFILFFPVIILLGETDSILLFLILYSVIFFEKGRYREGIFLLIINLAIKQTGLFLSMFIIIYYFINSQNKKRFLLYSTLFGSTLFFIICSPFILTGNFFSFINDFIYNSINVISPLSIKAFNLLAIPSNAHLIDFNYKPFIVSYKSYSILFISIIILLLSIKFYKKNIFTILPVFAIIWYNLQVGLHSHHIVYPAFFVLLFSALYNKYKIISFIYILLTYIDIVMNSSIVTMAIFHFPYMKYYFIQIFSIIQLIVGIIFIYKILKNEYKNIKISDFIMLNYKSMYIFIIIFIFFTVFMPGRIKKEYELMSYIIENKMLIDYSKDKYIQMDIYQKNPISNYLAVRMSDSSSFIFNNSFKNISFRVREQYGDSGILIINDDTFLIDKNEKIVEYNTSQIDTIRFFAISPKQFSQILLYNLNFSRKNDIE